MFHEWENRSDDEIFLSQLFPILPDDEKNGEKYNGKNSAVKQTVNRKNCVIRAEK